MANPSPSAVVVPSPGSSTNGPAQDIRDLKGPVEIPSEWDWLWWTLGTLAALALAFWLWKKWKARQNRPKPAVLIPPHRRAKERLRGATELISDPYAFCSLLSDVLRTYTEERFSYHAPERTTEEFLAEVRAGDRLASSQQQLLEDFLTRCDLVKFARYQPTEPELRTLYDAALRFIDETAVTPTETIQQQSAGKEVALKT